MLLRKRVRLVAQVVVVTFGSLCAQPTVAAFQGRSGLEIGKQLVRSVPQSVERAEALLDAARFEVLEARRVHATSGRPIIDRLLQMRRELVRVDKEVETQFEGVEMILGAKRATEAVMQRHRVMIARYRAARDEMLELLSRLESARQSGSDSEAAYALDALDRFLSQHERALRHTSLNPAKLPWRTAPGKKRDPILVPSEFEILTRNNSKASVAVSKAVPALPTQDDRSATVDIQLTTDVLARAGELGPHPVAILNWVRAHVEFLPTYGSVQGSSFTLQMSRGNAFDTSSLLIALLRANNIPARYVYGTVELPIANLMNWLGVTSANAALNLLAQGGIPSVPVSSGGAVVSVRMEHVWVEAWSDFTPSRGNTEKTPGIWIPLDASYKPNAITGGLNIALNVPFDAAGSLAAAQQGASVNMTEGWMQNLSQTNIQASLANYQATVDAYVASHNPTATVGDVLGTQRVNAKTESLLAGTTPYRVVAQGPRWSTLPATLRHQFQYALYSTPEDRAADNAVWRYQVALPQIAGKKVFIQFVPASQSDLTALGGYLPQPHADGSPIQLSEFPQVLPSSVHFRPELKVDGQTVASDGSFAFGSQLFGQGGFTTYDLSNWDLSPDDTLLAGQNTAIGISAQGISAAQLSSLKSSIDATTGNLTHNNFSSLDASAVATDPLLANVWGYFALMQFEGRMASRQAGVVDLPALSYGLFHAAIQPNKPFGVLTSARFVGGLMDIGHLRHIRWAKDNDLERWINYNRFRGQIASALEGAVPEAVIVDLGLCNSANDQASTLPPCPEAASAVKAIAVAASQGQKVFVITAQNQQVIGQLSVRPDTADEIRNLVQAGKEVTIHQSPVTIGGWTGTGYIVIDPGTGAGAYIIEGGANGAMIALVFFAVVLALCAPFIALFLGAAWGALIVAIFAAYNAKGMLKAIEAYTFDQDNLSQDQKEARLGVLALLSIAQSAFQILGAGAQGVEKATFWLYSAMTFFPNTLAKKLNSI